MKKILMTLVVAAAFACAARPGPHFGPHHHHHSVWGHGGRYFWPGFTGGLVGSLIAPIVTPPPPPVVMVNPVWVPPVYGTRPVYDAYGRIVRYEQYVITPGYWR